MKSYLTRFGFLGLLFCCATVAKAAKQQTSKKLTQSPWPAIEKHFKSFEELQSWVDGMGEIVAFEEMFKEFATIGGIMASRRTGQRVYIFWSDKAALKPQAYIANYPVGADY